MESMEGKGLILGFAQMIESLLEGGSAKNCCLLIDALTVKAGSEKSSVTQGCIGKGRAGDMAVNAVWPFFHALAIDTGNGALADRCGRMFRSFIKLPPNEITREMGEQLY